MTVATHRANTSSCQPITQLAPAAIVSIIPWHYRSPLQTSSQEKLRVRKQKTLHTQHLITQHIANTYQVANNTIRFKTTASGKKWVQRIGHEHYAKLTHSPLHISISHTHAYSAFAICSHPVGIDLETTHPHRPFNHKLLPRLAHAFGQTEHTNDAPALLAHTAPNHNQQRELAIKLWTYLEAHTKCYGQSMWKTLISPPTYPLTSTYQVHEKQAQSVYLLSPKPHHTLCVVHLDNTLPPTVNEMCSIYI